MLKYSLAMTVVAGVMACKQSRPTALHFETAVAYAVCFHVTTAAFLFLFYFGRDMMTLLNDT